MRRVLACSLIVFLFPLLVIVALAVLCSLGMPVFFSQKRLGQNSKIITVYKFRTMKKLGAASPDDKDFWADDSSDRITRVTRLIRKLKLDELPQLFNIVIKCMETLCCRQKSYDLQTLQSASCSIL